jgi:MFS transporter, ACS family, hexuronate transporter
MDLTLPSDLFPSEVVATLTDLTGLAAGLISTVFTLFIGTLVDHFSYFPAFLLAATAHVLATLSVVFLVRRARQSNATAPSGQLLEAA